MDLQTKLLQFFIIGAMAIIGWILSSNTLEGPLSNERLLLCCCFLIFGVTTWVAQAQVISRIRASQRAAYSYATKELQEDDDFKKITSDGFAAATNIGVPLGILATIGIIISM